MNNRSRLKVTVGTNEKNYNYENAPPLYEGPELILDAFKSIIFSIKETNGEGIKMFTRKQILQIL